MLHLYNYYTRNKEKFVPLIKDKVGMYLCGPTVYGEPHLGHARSAVSFDILHRYLKYCDYEVKYIRNITDVGSLENDIDETGEDKLAKQAKLEKREPMEVAHHYTRCYQSVLDKLFVLSPSIEPIASGHILEQQDYITRLYKKGWVYESNQSLYFDLTKFLKSTDVYGTLSRKKTEDLLAGQRELVAQKEKRSPLDFALWKNAAKSNSMKWQFLLQTSKDDTQNTQNVYKKLEGFPGWHLECSVMSEKYLGIPFDIHAGGLDLQFPHHEAEIAQCFATHQKIPARYWLYNNMITMNNKKMSKSLQNFITVEEFFTGKHKKLSRAYSPEIIRFFLLRSHYRSVVDVSDETLLAVAKGMEKLNAAYQKALVFLDGFLDVPLDVLGKKISSKNHIRSVCNTKIALDFHTQLCDAMDDDLNTPTVVATLFVMSSYILNTKKNTKEVAIIFLDFCINVLGLQLVDRSQNVNTADNDNNILIDSLLKLRASARNDKNFQLSDILRDVFEDAGIKVIDNPDGTSTWSYTK